MKRYGFVNLFVAFTLVIQSIAVILPPAVVAEPSDLSGSAGATGRYGCL